MVCPQELVLFKWPQILLNTKVQMLDNGLTMANDTETSTEVKQQFREQQNFIQSPKLALNLHNNVYMELTLLRLRFKILMN